MFLFLDFILYNVREYNTIYNLLLTSSEAKSMFCQFYKRHALCILSNTKSGAVQALLNRKMLLKPTYFRCQLCVLLDFLFENTGKIKNDVHKEKEDCFYLETEYFTYNNGKLMGKDWADYDADMCGEPAEIYDGDEEYYRDPQYYKHVGKPFEFSFSFSDGTGSCVGLLYSESQYVKHQRSDCHYGRLFCGNLFDCRCRENFHVISSMNSIWILVLLTHETKTKMKVISAEQKQQHFEEEYDQIRPWTFSETLKKQTNWREDIKKRCALQIHYPVRIDDTYTVNQNYIEYNNLINSRFYTLEKIAKIKLVFSKNLVY